MHRGTECCRDGAHDAPHRHRGLFWLLAGGMPAALALAPQSGAPVAAADGVLLAAPHNGRIAIATSAAADFIGRLYRSGAALVVDVAAAAACLAAVEGHFSKRTAL